MEELSFEKIDQERVGYRLQRRQNPSSAGLSSTHDLNVLFFRDFIPPYSSGAHSYQQVYANLESSLTSAIEQQGSVTGGKRSIMLDVLATAALQREATRNAMDLVREYYL